MSLSNCTLFRQQQPVDDSYCKLYEKVIQEKGDADIKAKPSVKRRILGNETIHKGICPS